MVAGIGADTGSSNLGGGRGNEVGGEFSIFGQHH